MIVCNSNNNLGLTARKMFSNNIYVYKSNYIFKHLNPCVWNLTSYLWIIKSHVDNGGNNNFYNYLIL